MIKIGYDVKNKALIQKIWNLYDYDHEFLIYELSCDHLNEMKDLKIDIMIYDVDHDDIKRLVAFEEMRICLNVKGICVVNEYADELIDMILNLHIEYLCESQITDAGLYVLLLRMINDHKKMKMSVYERIENLCLKKGVSTHLKGFDYLQSAILFYMENDRDCFRMKDVYDTIAKKHHTTSSRVEKNMRLAINASGSELSNAKFVDECFRECQYE